MAKSSLAYATEAEAQKFAPVIYADALSLLHEGDLEVAGQKGRLAPFRNYETADSLYLSAHRTAREAGFEALTYVAKRSAVLTRLQDGLVAELASWRRILDGSLMLYEAERAHSTAELALRKGSTLLAAKEFDGAAKAFNSAQESVGELVRIMDEYTYDRSEKLETWKCWVKDTIRASQTSRSTAIVVDKHSHTLYLVRSGAVVRKYECELGYNSAGQKMQAGDGATPEGKYRITHVIGRGSNYYKALRLDYPNQADRDRFAENKARGILSPQAGIGALIEIHGHGGQNKDWTEGCVALTNEDMDDLIRQVAVGTPVAIVRTADECL